MDERLVARTLWTVKHWAANLDVIWLSAISLLAFSIGFYLSSLRPMMEEAHQLRTEVATLDRKRHDKDLGSITELASPTRDLKEFYKYLPVEKELPSWLSKIYGVALNNGIAIEKGEYRMAKGKNLKVKSYQIRLPIKGTYPQIRGFIYQVLTSITAVSIDNVKFERAVIGEDVLSASIMMTLYIRDEP